MIGFEEFVVLLAGFLTLSIYSFLYKENPLYRFAEHLYVGVSAGYLFARAVNDVLYKKKWDILVTPDAGVVQDWWMLVPTILGFMMILKLVPRVSWVSRWAIALVVGGTIGLVMTTRFKADVIQQITGTTKKFQEARPSAASAYEKLGKLAALRIKAKTEGSLNQLTLSAGYLEQLDVFLRLQSKELFGKTQIGSEEWTRIVNSFQDYEKVVLQDRTSFIEIAQELQRVYAKHQLLPQIIKVELSKFERTVVDTLTTLKSNGKYSKEVADQVHAFNVGYVDRKKRQEELIKRDQLLQPLVETFFETVSKTAMLTPQPFSKASPDDLKSTIPFFTEYQRVWKSHWDQLKQLLTEFKSSADDLKVFEIEEQLNNQLQVDSVYQYFDRGKQFISALSSRHKAGVELLSTDLTKSYGGGLQNFLNALIMAFGVICILIYFFFSTEHKGGVGLMAKIGIYFLMITFGSSFGYTIMARISLLIGRMDFLLFDFGAVLRGVFGG